MNPNESPILALEQEKSKAAYTLMWSTTSIYILSDLSVFSILWSSVKSYLLCS
jgi:hypothetical protein